MKKREHSIMNRICYRMIHEKIYKSDSYSIRITINIVDKTVTYGLRETALFLNETELEEWVLFQ